MMKRVLILLASMFSLSASAGVVCHGETASKDPRKAGYIVYEIKADHCAPGDVCYQQIEKDRDSCAGSGEVKKMSCENGQPVKKTVACPKGTRCERGACS